MTGDLLETTHLRKTGLFRSIRINLKNKQTNNKKIKGRYKGKFVMTMQRAYKRSEQIYLLKNFILRSLCPLNLYLLCAKRRGAPGRHQVLTVGIS